jgi:hypothetical protein
MQPISPWEPAPFLQNANEAHTAEISSTQDATPSGVIKAKLPCSMQQISRKPQHVHSFCFLDSWEDFSNGRVSTGLSLIWQLPDPSRQAVLLLRYEHRIAKNLNIYKGIDHSTPFFIA